MENLVFQVPLLGVIGNSPGLTRYWIEVRKLTQKWLNRRSQRKSYGAEGFLMMWDNWGLPRPRIVEVPYQRHRPT